ncbi:hypothetical protein DFH29DRAFT_876570 [Suillus ampliporus]|nr:hypothetical protein DFH29DRAFT_876570 [Suillus ampliporus]
MPRQAPLDDAEDFTAELDAVEETGSDLGTLRRILTIPQPDAPMLEVHKALEIAQQAYNAARSELRVLKKDYAVLQVAIPARSRNRVLKKTSAVDSQITRAGKMYVMFHYFWVMNGLFPTTPQPNIDPRSDTCWASPEAKLNGAMAELYHCVPKSLHKAMETYSQFRSLICLIPIPICDVNVIDVYMCPNFVLRLKLDPTVFTDGPAEKKENGQLLALLKKHGGDEYTHLAPILFMNPTAMVPDDFLKTPIMVKIIRVEIFGKASLSGKTKGHPKARGAAIVAHFLLTHDQELMATGSATKIEYRQDYDFYLEHLFKRSSWAISVMDYYNGEVFGTSSVPASASAPSSTSQPCTWEDDFLQQLEAPAPAPAPVSMPLVHISTPTSRTNMVDVVSDHHTIMSVNQGGAASVTTQLQVDIGQLSLENDTEPSASSGRRLSAARQCQTTGVQPITQPELDSDAAPIIPLAPPPVIK